MSVGQVWSKIFGCVGDRLCPVKTANFIAGRAVNGKINNIALSETVLSMR